MDQISDTELFSAYLDGELTAEEQVRAEQLLVVSAEARQLLEEMRAVGAAMQNLPQVKLDEDLSARVLELAERRMLLPETGTPEVGKKTEADERPSAGRAAEAMSREGYDEGGDKRSVGWFGIPWRGISWRGMFSPRALTWTAVIVVTAVILHFTSPPKANRDLLARGGRAPAGSSPVAGEEPEVRSKIEGHMEAVPSLPGKPSAAGLNKRDLDKRDLDKRDLDKRNLDKRGPDKLGLDKRADVGDEKASSDRVKAGNSAEDTPHRNQVEAPAPRPFNLGGSGMPESKLGEASPVGGKQSDALAKDAPPDERPDRRPDRRPDPRPEMDSMVRKAIPPIVEKGLAENRPAKMEAAKKSSPAAGSLAEPRPPAAVAAAPAAPILPPAPAPAAPATAPSHPQSTLSDIAKEPAGAAAPQGAGPLGGNLPGKDGPAKPGEAREDIARDNNNESARQSAPFRRKGLPGPSQNGQAAFENSTVQPPLETIVRLEVSPAAARDKVFEGLLANQGLDNEQTWADQAMNTAQYGAANDFRYRQQESTQQESTGRSNNREVNGQQAAPDNSALRALKQSSQSISPANLAQQPPLGPMVYRLSLSPEQLDMLIKKLRDKTDAFSALDVKYSADLATYLPSDNNSMGGARGNGGRESSAKGMGGGMGGFANGNYQSQAKADVPGNSNSYGVPPVLASGSRGTASQSTLKNAEPPSQALNQEGLQVASRGSATVAQPSAQSRAAGAVQQAVPVSTPREAVKQRVVFILRMVDNRPPAAASPLPAPVAAPAKH